MHILTKILLTNYIDLIWMFLGISSIYLFLTVINKFISKGKLDDFVKPVTVGFIILFLVPVVLRTIVGI